MRSKGGPLGNLDALSCLSHELSSLHLSKLDDGPSCLLTGTSADLLPGLPMVTGLPPGEPLPLADPEEGLLAERKRERSQRAGERPLPKRQSSANALEERSSGSHSTSLRAFSMSSLVGAPAAAALVSPFAPEEEGSRRGCADPPGGVQRTVTLTASSAPARQEEPPPAPGPPPPLGDAQVSLVEDECGVVADPVTAATLPGLLPSLRGSHTSPCNTQVTLVAKTWRDDFEGAEPRLRCQVTLRTLPLEGERTKPLALWGALHPKAVTTGTQMLPYEPFRHSVSDSALAARQQHGGEAAPGGRRPLGALRRDRDSYSVQEVFLVRRDPATGDLVDVWHSPQGLPRGGSQVLEGTPLWPGAWRVDVVARVAEGGEDRIWLKCEGCQVAGHAGFRQLQDAPCATRLAVSSQPPESPPGEAEGDPAAAPRGRREPLTQPPERKGRRRRLVEGLKKLGGRREKHK